MRQGHRILRRSHDVAQMMKVIGEEGTALADYIDYLKGEFFDFVYLQQNAFDEADQATSEERQKYVFGFIYDNVLAPEFELKDKESALKFFQGLRQMFRGWNSAEWKTPEFEKTEKEIVSMVKARALSGKEAADA